MDATQIIYIIDDDLDDQVFLIEAIKEIDLSIECFTAMNGQEGLKKLDTRVVPHPSMIFLDINMPRMDGYKFLTAIKSHQQFMSVPVIVYTTSSNEKDRQEMMQLGAMDYIVKQPDFTALKETINQLFTTIH